MHITQWSFTFSKSDKHWCFCLFFFFFFYNLFYDFELLFNFWIKCIQKVMSITSPVASIISLSFTECSLFNDIFTTLNEIEVLKMQQITEKVVSLNAHFSPSSSTLLVIASICRNMFSQDSSLRIIWIALKLSFK